MPFMTAPFGQFFDKKKQARKILLDAIYIPTLANREKPVCNLELLLTYTKEIVFLFSDKTTLWDIKGLPQIRIESMIKQDAFLKDYLSKKGNQNPSTCYRPNFDIPIKRSFALFDAKKNKYRKILLLDDDIFITANNFETGMAALFEGVAIVGFHVYDYPDVSTLDHISRLLTSFENTISMTGSCMFVNVNKAIGNFPNVYNEDLFFFLQQRSADSIVSGGYVIQKYYEPWLSLERIKHEQFGDLIYDAIKKRFLSIESTPINWVDEIEEKKAKIMALLEKTSSKEISMALEAALEGLTNIDEKHIVEFIEANNFAEWVTKYF